VALTFDAFFDFVFLSLVYFALPLAVLEALAFLFFDALFLGLSVLVVIVCLMAKWNLSPLAIFLASLPLKDWSITILLLFIL
jgi:hypothetical protein